MVKAFLYLALNERSVILAYKLTCGMLFFTHSFVCKMSPLDMKDSFLDFQTSRYKFHYYETLTVIKGGHEY